MEGPSERGITRTLSRPLSHPFTTIRRCQFLPLPHIPPPPPPPPPPSSFPLHMRLHSLGARRLFSREDLIIFSSSPASATLRPLRFCTDGILLFRRSLPPSFSPSLLPPVLRAHTRTRAHRHFWYTRPSRTIHQQPMEQQKWSEATPSACVELLPLTYTGPAPPPVPPCTDPTPDEQYRQGVAEKRAALKQKESQKQTSSSGSGMLASLKNAVSQAVLTVEKGAADVSARTESQVRQLEYQYDRERFHMYFHELAAQGEVLLADYRCGAMHGGLQVNGHIQITNHYLCFFAETSSSITKTTDAVMGVLAAARHPVSANVEPRSRPAGITKVIPLAEIVSIQPSVVLETIDGQAPFFILLPAPTVRPTALQLYTRDNKLYQFLGFESLISRASGAINDVVKGTALDQAYNYLDHAWRETVGVPSKDVW
ncbi:hypothetical protein, conserved [Leishmania tarentolae]|uniref:GRAM domain-containing protein n=1 Tax=Leishmania tarentolae TaxID=5689 RepID=A0A640KD06_LEITA|nr:hypothetical protein, conserved [Leishmania tarentolae]